MIQQGKCENRVANTEDDVEALADGLTRLGKICSSLAEENEKAVKAFDVEYNEVFSQLNKFYI